MLSVLLFQAQPLSGSGSEEMDRCLARLAQGDTEALGRLSRDTLVGVVTHSPALMELIPARIEVLPAADGKGSRIAG